MKPMKDVHVTMAAVVLVAMLLGGCWSTGSRQIKSETLDSIDAKIFDGKTTKAEVRAYFGGPKKIDFSQADKEVWRYEFYYEEMDAQNLINPLLQKTKGTKKELVILFEDNGVVKKHTFSDSPFETRAGLLK